MRDRFSDMNKTKFAEAMETSPKPLFLFFIKRRSAYEQTALCAEK